jgi:8-oxo-dGTP pyrophosphatase MutT (NUDIX family)
MPVIRHFGFDRGEAFHRAAAAWVEGGSVAAEPRLAATVLLVRDGAAGPEVFVQQRAATMAFAPSMVVFPGGRVDPTDADAGLPEAEVREVADLMGVEAERAWPLVAAAVREVEEECGVRLAPGVLVPRGRWLTPRLEPRRYDTWFFAARMPDDQVARGTTRETVHEMWGRPVDLVARERAGTLALMPPTIVNLTQLARFEQTADVLTERPSLALVEPKLEQTADGWVLRSSIP